VVDTSRQPVLLGQTVVVIGGSSGIGLETGRRARAEGAEVILTGRNPQHLEQAGLEVGALKTAAFDATDPDQLGQFFEALTEPIDHVMVTAGGSYYASVADMDFAQVHRAFDELLVLPMQVARAAARRMHPGGTLIFMTGTAARHPAVGSAIAAIRAAAVPAITANLALELAPVRVNAIAAGFVDTPLSASLMGDDLEKRRQQLRETLPVRRVVEPTDIGSLAVYLMSNTAVTGATYDIDGGQQLLPTP
jgi:NAD(P)-dependent dehydrogenase (short-subunit alcohol dehydrogenase family)